MKLKNKAELIHGIQKYFAEFLGVFMLTTTIAFTSTGYGNLLPTPLAAALTVMLFVYTVGHISGAHLNPAVTFGLWINKNISGKDAIVYFLSQITAAMMATTIYAAIMNDNNPSKGWDITMAALVSEIIGTFILVFGVCNVANGKVSQGASGLVVGGSLLAGLGLASLYAPGVLNPAVALAFGSISIPFLVGPFVGAIIAVLAYKLLNCKGTK